MTETGYIVLSTLSVVFTLVLMLLEACDMINENRTISYFRFMFLVTVLLFVINV